MGNFTHVANYITKAESTPDTSDAVVLTGQLKVAAGLAHLEGKKYKQAARKFLEASPELEEGAERRVVDELRLELGAE